MTQIELFILILFVQGIGCGFLGARLWYQRKETRHWQDVARYYHRKAESLEAERLADLGPLVREIEGQRREIMRCAPPGTATIIPFRKPEKDKPL